MNRNAKILIVDDLEENLLALEAIIDLPEITLVKANSGEMALEMLLSHEIALVVLDVQMPGMDGFETAELMRGNHRTRDIPIIFVTAISKEDHYQFQGYESGAVDYLFKPLRPEILLGKIRVFVEMYFQKLELIEKTNILDRKVLELEQVKSDLETTNQRLEELSAHDALTNLFNRRVFDEKSEEELLRASRTGRPLSVAMVDIDYFKKYNDQYGHQQGDECLVRVSDALVALAHRPGDLVVRYGGEEFLLLLPETDLEGVQHIADNICSGIRDLRQEHAQSDIAEVVTVSVGAIAIAPYPQHVFGICKLIKAADEALYQAKHLGRDRAVVKELKLPTGMG